MQEITAIILARAGSHFEKSIHISVAVTSRQAFIFIKSVAGYACLYSHALNLGEHLLHTMMFVMRFVGLFIAEFKMCKMKENGSHK